MEEQKILKFYEYLVKLLKQNPVGGDNLFEECANSLLCGHELGDEGVCTPEFYESLLLCNISSINNISKGNKDEVSIYPFDEIDKEYYMALLKNNVLANILTYRRLMFISKLTDDLENNPESYMFQMVATGRPDYLEVVKEFGKIKKILRNGWIKRKVNSKYNESDATHSVQMLALASACFQLYPLKHLDKQKVYEMIIIHEIAETIVGDIVENSLEHLTKSESERIAVHKIFANLHNKEYFINLWEEFETRESEEAKLVYQLDKIDPVLKAKFLDKELNRDDLFDNFYDYEDKRGTFIGTHLQKLFYSNMY